MKIITFQAAIQKTKVKDQKPSLLLGNGFSIDFDKQIFSQDGLIQSTQDQYSFEDKGIYTGNKNFEETVRTLNELRGLPPEKIREKKEEFLKDIITALSHNPRGRFDAENLAIQLLTDTASYITHQQIQSISDDYHQSKQASHGRGHITQTTIEQQWESQLINDAKFTANTPLPSITFDVNDAYISEQLGQRVGEEVSHFYHPTPPRNPSGFWERIEQRYKNNFERQALIAEGRAAANSEVMHESFGHAAANQQNYLDLGYSESVVETRVAEWVSPIVMSASPPVTKLPIIAVKAYSLMNKWGLFGHNGAESLETGGRQIETVVGWNKVERQAIQYYKKIRFANSNTDVVLISKNTGIPEYRIQRVKEHLFFNEHTLSGGKVGRFDPYIEIADSWERLRAGSFVQQDLDLLNHEYFESRFEALYRTDYTTAHNAAVLSGRDWNPDGFVSTLEMIWRP